MDIDERVESYLSELDEKMGVASYEYDIFNDVRLSFGTQSREARENFLRAIEEIDAPYFDRHHLEVPNFELFVDDILIGLCHISTSYEDSRLFSSLNCVTLHPDLRGQRPGTCLTKFSYILTFKAVNRALIENNKHKVEWVFFADFDSEGGESVFFEAVESVKAEMADDSKVEYICEIEAGY